MSVEGENRSKGIFQSLVGNYLNFSLKLKGDEFKQNAALFLKNLFFNNQEE